MNQDLKRWLNFGSGVGIEIDGPRLRVSVVRVRPSGAQMVAMYQIENYRERPAVEWGAEYAASLKQHNVSHASAYVVLPRSEVIVRAINFQGVLDRDLDAAVGYQLEGLHPYGDEDVTSGYARLGETPWVLVAITKRETLSFYTTLFAEAGVAIANVSPSASLIWAGLRALNDSPAPGLLLWAERDTPDGPSVEVYGESESRPAYSVVFDQTGLENAARLRSLATSELRLDASTEPQALPDLAFTGAILSALPRRSLKLNLLPEAERTSSSRLWLVPTAVLIATLALLTVAYLMQQNYQNKKLLEHLRREIARVERYQTESVKLDAEVQASRARMALLDSMRQRTPEDLDTLLELTRILTPPGWLMSLDMTAQHVAVAGEAPQADALLQTLDASPRLKESQHLMPVARSQGLDQFRIRSVREIPPATTVPEAKLPAPEAKK
jgi:Tfp pilus assembly protein PilN